MTDILLDASGDLPAHPRHASGAEIIMQACRTRLLTFEGEWLLDVNVGIPYIAWRQQKPPRLNIWRATIQRELEQVAGVARAEITATLEGDQVRFAGELMLESGERLELTLTPPSIASGNTHPLIYIARLI